MVETDALAVFGPIRVGCVERIRDGCTTRGRRGGEGGSREGERQLSRMRSRRWEEGARVGGGGG